MFEDGTEFANGNLAISHNSDGSATILWSLGEGKNRTGRCRIWFSAAEPGKVSQIQLYQFGGMTPSSLARFPWKKYIAAAWAAKVANDSPEPGNIASLMRNLDSIRDETPAPRSRPGAKRGRKGHGREFFENVCIDYYAAMVRSPRSPVKQLAEERCVSVTTARAWVNTARKLGIMPPGSRGRAG